MTAEQKQTISAIISLGSAALGATTGNVTDVVSSGVAGTTAVEENGATSLVGGKIVSSQVNKQLDGNIDDSGRRIIAGTAGGMVSGAITGCAAGSVAGGIGCIPGALIGGIYGIGGGFVTSGLLEASGLGQPIEDWTKTGIENGKILINTGIGYVEYNIINNR